MRRTKEPILAIILILSLIIGMLPPYQETASASPESGNPSILPARDIENPNSVFRYAVGFMYVDIWSNSSGQWSPYAPRQEQARIEAPYTFSFPGRTVKNVTIRSFDNSNDDTYYFNKSRPGDVGGYESYSNYIGRNGSQPTIKDGIQGKNTDTVSFTAQMTGTLDSNEYYQLPCSNCSSNVRGYRFYFPIVYVFELNGSLEVHHYTTDGNNIDSSFPNQTKPILKGETIPLSPAASSDYEYVGYKESTSNIPNGGSIISGNPPSFTYDGSYDTKFYNLYYTKKADGTAYIRHVTRDGTSLDNVFTDKSLSLSTGKNFSPSYPTADGYAYAGYVKTTSGTAPSNFSNPSTGNYTLTPYDGSFKTLYLYYVYDVSGGQLNVRHMVRNGQSGSYQLKDEQSSAVSPLPSNKTVQADTKWGTVVGKSISYTSYSDTVEAGSSVTASLTNSQKKAYVTFFYQTSSPSFTADFDVTPKISYGDPITFHPKDPAFEQCIYTSHSYKITQGPFSNNLGPYSRFTDTVITKPQYPTILGVGTYSVYMTVTTSCGTSKEIGPKPLEVIGPSKNNPPIFKIGFVDPEGDPTKPLSSAYEGQRLNLVVIQDPTIPVPVDPDGDSIIFDGFDFAGNSNVWVQNIPSRYGGETMMWEYSNLLMDKPGGITINAAMRDQWGAVATASTFITIVPPNPVAKITGPYQIKQNRPLPEPFSAASSYSPIKYRTIDHSRDEWAGDIRNMYTTPGDVVIKLNVYDSMGLKSLEPAVHTLKVLEDMPPVPKLEFGTPSLRNIFVPFKNTSYSPDGDVIVENKVSYQYDSNNDGVYDYETEVPITMRADKTFDFKGMTVGKYRFKVYVKEDYGKEATGYFLFEVINDSPQVSFEVKSESTQPEPLVPIPLSTKTFAEDRTKWTNSNFKDSNKISSWAYNPSNGGLVAPWASFHRADLFITGDQYSTFRSPTSEFNSFSNYLNPEMLSGGIVAIPRYNNTAGIYSMGYDFYRGSNLIGRRDTYDTILSVDANSGIVYTRNQNATAAKAYYPESFVNPAGEPFATPTEFYSNGKRYKFDFPTGLGSSIDQNLGSIPTKFSDSVYHYNYYSGTQMNNLKNTYTWDGGVSSKTWYNNDEYQINTLAGEGAMMGGSVDKDMNYGINWRYKQSYSNSFLYRDMDSDVSDDNARPGVTSNGKVLISFDGKWVVSNQGVFNRNSPSYNPPVTPLDSSNVTIMALTDTNYLAVSNYYSGTLNLYKLNSDGSLSTVRSYPTPSSFTIYMGMDNNNNIIYYSGTQIFKLNTNTLELKKVADLLDTPYSIDLLGTGDISVAYRQGSRDDQVIYDMITSSDSRRKEDTYVSSQNQLLGQIKMKNVAYNFKMKLNMAAPSYLFSGFSFHAQDNRNMYRVEINNATINLVRVVGGVRQIVQSSSYPFNQNQQYSFKIQVLDEKIKVYVNGTPVIDISENYFKDGVFGPFAEIPKTEFFSMSYTDLAALSTTTVLQGIGLVDRDLIYTIRNDDTENDPLILDRTSWLYNQLDQKFLDSGDGKSGNSSYNGKWYTSPVLKIDKVGLYQISYKTVDDPHPSYRYPSQTFDSYRKESNTSVRNVIIHRPPIVDYDLGLNADGTVKWTDRSRDPDRYLSPTNYSTENTGIDYYRTKGILEKKFYYVSPSGKFVRTKLVSPDEIGEYTVGLAVKDEYEAWSEYLEKTITIGSIPRPDEPPHAGFDLSSAVTYRGVPIGINSTAWDKEDGGRVNLQHDYFIRNLDGGTETMASQNREYWEKAFSTMGSFRIRQVVEDHLGQTDTISKNVQVINRIPIADIYIPSSANQNSPDKLTVFRPTFKWNYGDFDNDPQSKYQVKIYRYGGYLEQESGIKNGNSLLWIPEADLPEHTNMYIVVRVFDGYDWGESSPKFFYLETNRPPTADFDYSPKPVYEGDNVSISQQIDDPDGDQLQVNYQIVGPDNVTNSFPYQLTRPYSTAGPSLVGVKPGIYKVTLSVSDGKAPAVIVVKTISVLPLGLTGAVSHTERWIENMSGYNAWLYEQLRANKMTLLKYTELYHKPDDFFAGEPFVLSSQTTTILPGSNVTAVQVWSMVKGSAYPTSYSSPWFGNLTYLDRKLSSTNSGKTSWSGIVNDPYKDILGVSDKVRLETLQNGYLDFTFYVQYSNGTIKEDSVRINIKGNVNDLLRVHRLH
ncbi:hypothetical protein ACLBWT_18715 [Paenibacillus sp. D51F]